MYESQKENLLILQVHLMLQPLLLSDVLLHSHLWSSTSSLLLSSNSSISSSVILYVLLLELMFEFVTLSCSSSLFFSGFSSLNMTLTLLVATNSHWYMYSGNEPYFAIVASWWTVLWCTAAPYEVAQFCLISHSFALQEIKISS